MLTWLGMTIESVRLSNLIGLFLSTNRWERHREIRTASSDGSDCRWRRMSTCSKSSRVTGSQR